MKTKNTLQSFPVAFCSEGREKKDFYNSGNHNRTQIIAPLRSKRAFSLINTVVQMLLKFQMAIITNSMIHNMYYI